MNLPATDSVVESIGWVLLIPNVLANPFKLYLLISFLGERISSRPGTCEAGWFLERIGEPLLRLFEIVYSLSLIVNGSHRI